MDTNKNEQMNKSESNIDTQIENLASTETSNAPEVVDEVITEVVDSSLDKLDEIEEGVEITESEEAVSVMKDYSNFSKTELLDELTKLIDKPVEEIRREVEILKKCFYNLHNAAIEKHDKQNAEIEGEAEIAPYYDKVEEDFRTLIGKYKHNRGEYIRSIEDQKEFNYQTKLQIIEELKVLLNEEESLNQTFTKFHDIQNRWRLIGQVPQARIKDIWDTYHHNVEKFYDYVKINKELRDLDLKRNLDIKKALIQKGQELLEHNSVNEAFATLQKLHNSWRETGPVPRENKDTLWDSFKDLTAQINKKYQAYFEQRKEEQTQNYALKEKLCARMEALALSTALTVKEWQKLSDELIHLQDEWKGIGFVPKKENNEIYARFKEQRDKFFHTRRHFYKKIKAESNTNLKVKKQLCEQAEALMNSEEWKETSDILINLQKEWKASGHVPRKISDELWKRFRSACDAFFDKKTAHFSEQDGEHVQNLQAKEALIAEIVAFTLGDDREANFEALKDFQNRWRAIGFVPMREKNKIQKRYQDAIDEQYTALKASPNSDDHKPRHDQNEHRSDRNRDHRDKDNRRAPQRSENRGGRSDKDKLAFKIQQLENDITLWENNIGFFAKSKNADKMIQDVQAKIDNAHIEIADLAAKIQDLD